MACQFYCPTHYGVTMNAVNDFVQQRSFVDVKLVCKNKKIVYSHKLILASASPFLKAVIEEMNNFDDMFTMYLPDFDYNIVNLLLTFLYEGVMKLTQKELEEFRELCNGLCMIFPGADVVKVLNDDHHSSSGTRQTADIAVHPVSETILGENSPSLMSSRGGLHAPAKIPDTANKPSTVVSTIPKIEDCEDCQNYELNDNDFQNTGQMNDTGNMQKSLASRDFSVLSEKHSQLSLDTDDSMIYSEELGNSRFQRNMLSSHSDAHKNLNLCRVTAGPGPKVLQNNETSIVHSNPILPIPVQNFQNISNTQQMTGLSKATTRDSCYGVEMNSIPLMKVSAAQVNFYSGNAGAVDQLRTYQPVRKRSKVFHDAADVQEENLTQILNSHSVPNKLTEQTGVISHNKKQSQHLKGQPQPSNSKVLSKRQSVQKSVQPKRRKSEG